MNHMGTVESQTEYSLSSIIKAIFHTYFQTSNPPPPKNSLKVMQCFHSVLFRYTVNQKLSLLEVHEKINNLTLKTPLKIIN